MTKIRRLAAAAGMVVVIAGCSTGPSTVDLTGDWFEPITIPGSSFVVHFDESGSTLSGHGCWSAEAGGSGTFTLTGTRAAGTAAATITGPTGLGGAVASEWSIRILDGDHLTVRGLAPSSSPDVELTRGSAGSC